MGSYAGTVGVEGEDVQDGGCAVAMLEIGNGISVECLLKTGIVRCVTVPGHTTAVACRCQTIGRGQRKGVLRQLLAVQRNARALVMRWVPALAPKQATHRHWLLCLRPCASIRSSDAGEGSDCYYPALPTRSRSRSRCRVRGPVSTPVLVTNNRVYLEYPADMRSLGAG